MRTVSIASVEDVLAGDVWKPLERGEWSTALGDAEVDEDGDPWRRGRVACVPQQGGSMQCWPWGTPVLLAREESK